MSVVTRRVDERGGISPAIAGAARKVLELERSLVLSSVYDEHYFRTYRGGSYEKNTTLRAALTASAEAIVREIDPRTVLDVGCAMGFLVEALRDRGVEAYGLDVSRYAVERIRESIRSYCWVATIAEPISGRYDLIVCHEVLEHLPANEAATAIGHLCDASDDVLFASSPDDYGEETHRNVQPAEYWAELFAQFGFIRDLEFDALVLPAPWAHRFRRSTERPSRVVRGYERRLVRALEEVRALRERAGETQRLLAERDRTLAERHDTASLEQTIAEQQDHIEALSVRCDYLSDRENELRSLLHDAHEQLLERDAVLAQRNPISAASDAQTIAELHRVIDERTRWAERVIGEAEKRLEIIHQQRAAIEALQRQPAFLWGLVDGMRKRLGRTSV